MDHSVAIIGAGFGGMGAAIALQRAGVEDFVILEREADLGGTWHVNHYPGLTVDIPSTFYSFSFAPAQWKHVYARGKELKAYCDHIADSYELRDHMRFSTVVDSARWDDDAAEWVVGLADGSVLRVGHLITATGYLSRPAYPDIPGVRDFAGVTVHTGAWDDDLDLTGRRVAVIGTGATSAQLVPAIARRVADLTVFQRTPIWAFPKLDLRIGRVGRTVIRRTPGLNRLLRGGAWAFCESLVFFGVLHFRAFFWANSMVEQLIKVFIRTQVHDPQTRRQLTPTYAIGCKRPTFMNTYYRTFNRANVHLETTPIDRIEADAVVTADGTRHEIDVLVLATGYNIWESGFPAIEVTGRDGRDLGTWWRQAGFQAYLGSSMPYFPNFLAIEGPWTYSGLSYFSGLEPQMTIIERLFAEQRRRGARRWEVTEAANDAFFARMRRGVQRSIFLRGSCAATHTYYIAPSGEAPFLRTTSTLSTAREAKRFAMSNFTFD